MRRTGHIWGAVAAFLFLTPALAATLNFFQPNDNSGRVGYLALNNTSGSAVNVTLSAVDDTGTAAPGGNITLSLSPSQSVYLSSADVANGRSSVMTGKFGTGTGYWHLTITATNTITVQNFLYTPDGALSEHTTSLTAETNGTYFVKFFTEPGASVFESQLRLRNLSSQQGTVTVTAVDSAGNAVSGSAVVTLAASSAVEITSSDLSQGNKSLGVTGGLGHGDGFWILTLTPTVSIAAYAQVQAAGGNLADVGSGLTVSSVATTSSCPTSNFLTLTANSHNSAYPAPTLSVSCGTSEMTITSNGIPNFEFVQVTPNALEVTNNTYHVPLSPTVATGTNTTAPMVGPEAVTVAGLPIFGPTESPSDGSEDPYKNGLLDTCGGHTAPGGEYHHHYRPDCLFTSTQQTGLVIGYAFDGYPILAPYECTDTTCKTTYKVHSSYTYIGGSTASWSSNAYVAGSGNLDECNGMTRPDGTYAYYATDEFPYFLACFHGVPDSSNFSPGATFATIVVK